MPYHIEHCSHLATEQSSLKQDVSKKITQTVTGQALLEDAQDAVHPVNPVLDHSAPSQSHSFLAQNDPYLSQNDSLEVLNRSHLSQDHAAALQNDPYLSQKHSKTGNHDAAQYFCHHSVVFRQDLTQISHHS
ncbi:MAG: hypothetical protein Q3M30_00215 [Candidatus Electrothrix sp. Rat3]|nr:hypothetical protein [Candidatus Electrothrix rattekaaiensis]